AARLTRTPGAMRHGPLSTHAPPGAGEAVLAWGSAPGVTESAVPDSADAPPLGGVARAPVPPARSCAADVEEFAVEFEEFAVECVELVVAVPVPVVGLKNAGASSTWRCVSASTSASALACMASLRAVSAQIGP